MTVLSNTGCSYAGVVRGQIGQGESNRDGTNQTLSQVLVIPPRGTCPTCGYPLGDGTDDICAMYLGDMEARLEDIELTRDRDGR